MNFKIEIFPDLDDEENSISWNYTAMVYFDKDSKRRWAKYESIKSSGFDIVENNFTKTLEKEYDYLNSLKEDEIPFIIIPLSQNL